MSVSDAIETFVSEFEVVFMVYVHTSVHMPNLSNLIIIAIKQKAAAMMLTS